MNKPTSQLTNGYCTKSSFTMKLKLWPRCPRRGMDTRGSETAGGSNHDIQWRKTGGLRSKSIKLKIFTPCFSFDSILLRQTLRVGRVIERAAKAWDQLGYVLSQMLRARHKTCWLGDLNRSQMKRGVGVHYVCAWRLLHVEYERATWRPGNLET